MGSYTAVEEDADILIAATAMKHGMVVVTDNTQHFKRIKGLKVENWLKA
jgi:tRNA(fMet)-specific endonuclease VapC